jgi:hypothetical protein
MRTLCGHRDDEAASDLALANSGRGALMVCHQSALAVVHRLWAAAWRHGFGG